jgi:hypothetical protein
MADTEAVQNPDAVDLGDGEDEETVRAPFSCPYPCRYPCPCPCPFEYHACVGVHLLTHAFFLYFF